MADSLCLMVPCKSCVLLCETLLTCFGLLRLGSDMQGHREGCLCVICKQARRTGKPWAGMEGGAELAARWVPPPPPTAVLAPRVASNNTAPLLRCGKRAYLRATPHIVAGARRHSVRIGCHLLAVSENGFSWPVHSQHKCRHHIREESFLLQG